MRLTNVFNSQDQFEKTEFVELRKQIDATYNDVKNSVTPVLSNSQALNILTELESIKQSIQTIEDTKSDVLLEFSRKIKLLEKEYLSDSYALYQNRFARDFPKDILNYVPNTVSLPDINEVKAKLKQYVDWTFPGLEIGPGIGNWTRDLVSCDPLYVIDIHESFLKRTKEQFSDQYKRRLRTYVIEKDNYDLTCLPQNQMGLVFSWNVFEFLPYDHIKQYLQSIYNVMRPGGVLFFSYNNAQLYGSCQLSEAGLRCYMTRKRMVDLTEGLGFSIIEAVDRAPHLSYIIVRKNNAKSITHNRAGQTLGEIIDPHKPSK